MIPNPDSFARDWICAWNVGDLDAILAHYHESVEFHSPKASLVLGRDVIRGRTELRQFWSEGLKRARIHFELDSVMAAPVRSEIALFYRASLNERKAFACETFRFNEAGLITFSIAYYGTDPTGRGEFVSL